MGNMLKFMLKCGLVNYHVINTHEHEPVISEVYNSATPASAPSTAGAATEAPNEVPATPMEVVSQNLI